jgi:hypothetical protein
MRMTELTDLTGIAERQARPMSVAASSVSSMKIRRAAPRSSHKAAAAALFGLDDQTGTAGRPRREEVLSNLWASTPP